jgi:hypothetical protein
MFKFQFDIKYDLQGIYFIILCKIYFLTHHIETLLCIMNFFKKKLSYKTMFYQRKLSVIYSEFEHIKFKILLININVL